MQQQIFKDDWHSGLELQYIPMTARQRFYCRGKKPQKGDLIRTRQGPDFVVVVVNKVSCSFYSGFCVED
jgi:hypothetical protein